MMKCKSSAKSAHRSSHCKQEAQRQIGRIEYFVLGSNRIKVTHFAAGDFVLTGGESCQLE